MSGFRSGPVPTADWIPVRGKPESSLPAWIYSSRRWVGRSERWDVPPRWVFVPSGNDLRKVDLNTRTIKTVFETREPIVDAGVPMIASWSVGHPTKEQPVLVRTTGQIYELDQQDRVIKVFAIPTEIDRRSTVQWYETVNGQSIAVFSRDSNQASKQVVYRIADDGAIQEQFELDLQTGSSVQNKQADAFGRAFVILAPAILFAVELLHQIAFDEIESYPAAFTALLKNSGPSLIAVLALSLILAVMAWRRSRAFGLSRKERTGWVLFVLLFGLPAYVGFLLYRHWTIRLPCPNCHARVPRDRVECAECGRRFREASLKGIEIFA
jgi:hypothetical protein